MNGGIFLLLCVLAFFIGTRARRSKTLSPKALKNKEKFKKVLLIITLFLTALLVILFLPIIFYDIRIAIDTRFDVNFFINIGIILLSGFTFYTALRKLQK